MSQQQAPIDQQALIRRLLQTMMGIQVPPPPVGAGPQGPMMVDMPADRRTPPPPVAAAPTPAPTPAPAPLLQRIGMAMAQGGGAGIGGLTGVDAHYAQSSPRERALMGTAVKHMVSPARFSEGVVTGLGRGPGTHTLPKGMPVGGGSDPDPEQQEMDEAVRLGQDIAFNAGASIRTGMELVFLGKLVQAGYSAAAMWLAMKKKVNPGTDIVKAAQDVPAAMVKQSDPSVTAGKAFHEQAAAKLGAKPPLKPHEYLGIPPNATEAQAKSAWRRILLTIHQDTADPSIKMDYAAKMNKLIHMYRYRWLAWNERGVLALPGPGDVQKAIQALDKLGVKADPQAVTQALGAMQSAHPGIIDMLSKDPGGAVNLLTEAMKAPGRAAQPPPAPPGELDLGVEARQVPEHLRKLSRALTEGGLQHPEVLQHLQRTPAASLTPFIKEAAAQGYKPEDVQKLAKEIQRAALKEAELEAGPPPTQGQATMFKPEPFLLEGQQAAQPPPAPARPQGIPLTPKPAPEPQRAVPAPAPAPPPAPPEIVTTAPPTPDGVHALIKSQKEQLRALGPTGTQYQPGPEVQQVPLRDIVEDPDRFQRRLQFNFDQVADIINKWEPAKLDPLVLNYEGGKLYLLSGHHRFAAATARGDLDFAMPARIVELPQEAAVDLATTANMDQRHYHPIELGKIYAEGLDTGLNLHEVAEKYSSSVSDVRSLSRLNALSPRLQEMLLDKELSVEHGQAIANVLAKYELSAAEQARLAGEWLPTQPEMGPATLEKTLERFAKARNVIRASGGGGPVPTGQQQTLFDTPPSTDIMDAIAEIEGLHTTAKSMKARLSGAINTFRESEKLGLTTPEQVERITEDLKAQSAVVDAYAKKLEDDATIAMKRMYGMEVDEPPGEPKLTDAPSPAPPPPPPEVFEPPKPEPPEDPKLKKAVHDWLTKAAPPPPAGERDRVAGLPVATPKKLVPEPPVDDIFTSADPATWDIPMAPPPPKKPIMPRRGAGDRPAPVGQESVFTPKVKALAAPGAAEPFDPAGTVAAPKPDPLAPKPTDTKTTRAFFEILKGFPKAPDGKYGPPEGLARRLPKMRDVGVWTRSLTWEAIGPKIDGIEDQLDFMQHGGGPFLDVFHNAVDVGRFQDMTRNDLMAAGRQLFKGIKSERDAIKLTYALEAMDSRGRIDPERAKTFPEHIVKAARGLRQQYNEMHEFVNRLRESAGLEPIAYRDFYSPHVLRAEYVRQGAISPSETIPEDVFNPRMLKRLEESMDFTKQEFDARKIFSGYAHHVVRQMGVPIMQQAGAAAKAMQAAGLNESAGALQFFVNSAFNNYHQPGAKLTGWFLGVQARTHLLLNAAYLMFTQGSSMAFNGRFGIESIIKGLSGVASPEVRAEVLANPVFQGKRGHGLGVVGQDRPATTAVSGKLDPSPFEKVERFAAAIFNDNIEAFTDWTTALISIAHLNKHGITDPKARHQFIGQMIMANQDYYSAVFRPRMLAQGWVRALLPFSRFGFTAFSRLLEQFGVAGMRNPKVQKFFGLPIPDIKARIALPRGKVHPEVLEQERAKYGHAPPPPGAEKDVYAEPDREVVFELQRMAAAIGAITGIAAGIFAFNRFSEWGTGRKVVTPASGLPFAKHFVDPVLTALGDPRGAGDTGAPLPLTMLTDLGAALREAGMFNSPTARRAGEALGFKWLPSGKDRKVKYGKLRQWGLTWLPGGIGLPGGRQLARIVDGALAVQAGGRFSETTGEPLHPIEKGTEKVRAIGLGTSTTRAAREFYKESGDPLIQRLRDDRDRPAQVKALLDQNLGPKGRQEGGFLFRRAWTYRERQDKHLSDFLSWYRKDFRRLLRQDVGSEYDDYVLEKLNDDILKWAAEFFD